MFKMYILYDMHGVFLYLLYVDNILTLRMNEYYFFKAYFQSTSSRIKPG